MTVIDGTTISLTRGDTLKVKLNLKNSVGEPYVPDEGDTFRFGVKKSYKDENLLITKVIPSNTLVLHLEPSDTKKLSFGNYFWDCQIEKANGDVFTFISKAVLKITEEVV